ncbi:ATP-binding cassette domain-containing protein [Tersicoccus sp. MR15.9]|uniref:ABC transporter ATP-binding protein n=1 Tax=Tersicoccus mangrovi TaxID=3121635 RepID=UPI002FE53008
MDITATNITLRRGGKILCEGLDLHASAGELTAVIGASGSGKTTLLNCLALLERVNEGQLRIGGRDMTTVPESARRRFWRDSAAFIFQDYGLIDAETVAYNVMMSTPPLFRRRALTNPAVNEALSSVRLEGRGGEKVATLSGGEKQRVGLARAMYKNAAIIFADEPTASLDHENRDLVIELLRQAAARGATIVLATHDDAAITAADHRLHLGTHPATV